MRITKPLVGLILSGTLAIGLVMAQDDLDLDALLGDLDAETTVENVGDAVEAASDDVVGDLDDLFGIETDTEPAKSTGTQPDRPLFAAPSEPLSE